MVPASNRFRRAGALPRTGWVSKPGAAVFVFLSVAVCLWYWPVLTGQQPVGGDVTAFFYPLMSSYATSLTRGDWPPLWNDRWGYGFPALAESQMGIFYPPHLLLFGILSPATAYSVNLLLSMLLAAWFAYLAGRTLGLGPMGSGLCGLIFFAGDFFTIHAPHQWAYTTGCWFPLAVLLAWRTLRLPRLSAVRSDQLGVQESHPGRLYRSSAVLPAALLAAVLAVQMFGGHFQLAFYTQVTVLLLALGSLFVSGRSWRTRFTSAGLVVAAWTAGLLLAAVQLLPTAELARQSTLRAGDYEYLSGFANTPWHLVNYLAGSLFHDSPLWRGVVWSPSMPGAPDPWRTAPEECLNYVGLIPLCLVLAGWRSGWSSAPVRLCTAMLTIALLLSFGPYLPGFGLLIRLPGFGWFRSAARWNLATTFWMAVLAGATLERLSAIELRRALKRFAVLWMILIVAVVVVLWALSQASAAQDKILRQMHTPPDTADVRVVAHFVEQGYSLHELRALTLADQWPSVLAREVAPYAAIVVLISALCLLPRLPEGSVKATLFLLALLDLALLTTVRPLSWQPAGHLKNSPVLQVIAKRAKCGTVHRTVDPFRNLSLAAGAAPVLAYRTIDVPVFATVPLFALTEIGQRPLNPELMRIFHLSGIETVVDGASRSSSPADASAQSVSDPVIVASLYGKGYAEHLPTVDPALLNYRVLSYDGALPHAWTVAQVEPRTASNSLQALPDPESVAPARVERLGPHHVVLEATVDGPSLLVLTDLYYPGWEANLESPGSSAERSATILKAFDAWRAIQLPHDGHYRVDLRYRPRAYGWGKWISASTWVAWLLLLGAAMAARRAAKSGRRDPAADSGC